MIANTIRFGRRAAVIAGLVLAGLGFAAGIAAADDAFVPVLPDPSQITSANPLLAPQPSYLTPGAPGVSEPVAAPSNTVGLLSGTQQLMPLLTDATQFLKFSQDPNGYVGALQNLLNDGGNLLGVPSAGSYIPQMPVTATDPAAIAPAVPALPAVPGLPAAPTLPAVPGL